MRPKINFMQNSTNYYENNENALGAVADGL